MINKNSELTGGELYDPPNEYYRNFFKKFEEIETLEVHKWKPVHILSYFCKKYKDHYNVNYQFKFNTSSPSKCFEIFQIKKLAMHLTASPVLLKEYIDWIFIDKIIKAKRKFTSISFITNETTVKEYKFNVLLSDKKNANINRSTLLSNEYKTVFAQLNFPANTYGDLAFISQMPDMPIELVKAFTMLESMGFDKNILKKIV